jgi:hypothetical protein
VRCRVAFAAALVLLPGLAFAQATAAPPLFDHLAGHWVLRGTIGGQQTTHDVVAEPVLKGGYMRLHEVSREKAPDGGPAYEAIIFISVDAQSGEYKCLWLDNTSNAGLVAQSIGHATPKDNSLPFLFTIGDTDVLHTTFTYSPDGDRWHWTIEDESKGKTTPFADVTLTKK